MADVVIKKVDGVEIAVATVEFNLGEVYREKENTMVAGFGVEGMIKFYQELLYQKGTEKDWKGFNETLEQYRTFILLDTVGVKLSPLRFNKQGALEGLKEGVTYE